MNEKQQIEEMAKVLKDYTKKNNIMASHVILECYAEELYSKNYRKQSEGEWETIPDYQPNKLITYRHICSVCKTTYKDIRSHGHKYCHECGAKMKGGAE